MKGSEFISVPNSARVWGRSSISNEEQEIKIMCDTWSSKRQGKVNIYGQATLYTLFEFL